MTEIQCLQALLLASEAKVRELEETVAACVKRGANLRDALTYYSDIGGPMRDARIARDALKRDRALTGPKSPG